MQASQSALTLAIFAMVNGLNITHGPAMTHFKPHTPIKSTISPLFFSLAVKAALATLLQDLYHALRFFLLQGYLDVSSLKMGCKHVARL